MNPAQGKAHLSSFFRVLLQDVGFGLRQLRKSPGFAAVVIGSLALGIGASVAVFSVVRAVLLDPYPYKDADRMIHVELRQKNSDRNELLNVTFTEFHDLQRLPSVDDVFLMDNRMQALTGDCAAGLGDRRLLLIQSLHLHGRAAAAWAGSSLPAMLPAAMPARWPCSATSSGRSNTAAGSTSSARPSNSTTCLTP